jgi:hypothetical protein
MLYLALRMRAEEEIMNNGNLESGLYDLALSEGFAPLDADSINRREWARLYLLGASFWNVFPEEALYYFRQLVFAAPYLHDTNGFTAAERYRQALLQYGDQLAQAGAWCEAQVQYEAAIPMSPNDPTVEARALDAREKCENPASPTVEATVTTPTLGTPSPTTTISPTEATTLTPTTPVETTPVGTTATSEASPTASPTIETTQTPTVEPSLEPTPEPGPTSETTPASP